MTAFLHVLALFLAMGHGNTQRQAVTGYRISGVVVDAATAAPIPQAQVSTFLNNEEITTATGDDGRFSLDRVPAGKYMLSAAAPGYVREAYDQHGPYSTAIVAGDDQDSEHLVFRLHPQAVLFGRVTDQRGEPVRFAQVQLFGSQRSGASHAKFAQAQVQANDLGEYRFAHLFPGKYYLAVQARPWYAETQLSAQSAQYSGFPREGVIGDGHALILSETNTSEGSGDVDRLLDVVYPVTFYPGVTDERSSTELVVGAGEKQEANITLQAVPATRLRLTGLPTDNGSSLNVGASQKVFGAPLGMGVVSSQISPGKYEIAGLPPGEVTVVVNTIKGGEWSSRTMEADTRSGGTLDASALQTTARVSGRIILTDGSPKGTAGNVILANNAATILPSVTVPLKEDGTFQFPEIQPGTYRVQVNLHVGGYYVQNVSAKEAKASGREITIAGGNDVEMTIAMGQGQGQVSGVVQLEGKPLAGVMVLLVPESGQEMEEDSRMDQSDSDGSFNLGGILPGKYVLVAIKDGWDLEWAKPSVLKPYWEAGQRLSIAPNQSMKVTVAAQEKALAIKKKP